MCTTFGTQVVGFQWSDVAVVGDAPNSHTQFAQLDLRVELVAGHFQIKLAAVAARSALLAGKLLKLIDQSTVLPCFPQGKSLPNQRFDLVGALGILPLAEDGCCK